MLLKYVSFNISELLPHVCIECNEMVHCINDLGYNVLLYQIGTVGGDFDIVDCK